MFSNIIGTAAIYGTLLALVMAAAVFAAPYDNDPPRFFSKCFSKQSWSSGTVPVTKRPCVRITRVEEDGSFTALVASADGTDRASVGVGNPRD